MLEKVVYQGHEDQNMTESMPLTLHIPTPSTRPGDVPSFAHLSLDDAGAARRPEPAAPEMDMRDMPYRLVRILDDDGHAVGPWVCNEDPDLLKTGLRAMVQTRIFEERLFRAHRQGKTSFFMKSTGEEDWSGAILCPRARRHVFSHISFTGMADSSRLSNNRHDQPDLFKRE